MVSERNKITKLIKFIKSRCETSPGFGDNFFRTSMIGNRFIAIPDSCYRQFSYITNILYKKAKANRIQISKSRIDSMLVSSLFNILHNNSNPSSETNRLLSGIKSEHKIFKIFIPIYNLSISEVIDMGRVKLIPILSYEYFYGLVKGDKFTTGLSKYIWNKFFEEFDDSNRYWTAAEITVFAIDQERAEENAFELLELVLSFLRLFNSSDLVCLPQRKYLAIKLLMVLIKDSMASFSLKSYNFDGNPYVIDTEKLIELMPFILAFKSLINKKKLTEFEDSIIMSIKWAGDAVNENSQPIKLIKYVMCLEAIMHLNGRNKREQFADNIVHTLYRRSKTRTKNRALKLSKELYEVRSSIVHSGKFYHLMPGYIAQLDYWTKAILQLAIMNGQGKNQIRDIA